MRISITKKEDVQKFANIFKNLGGFQEFIKLDITPTGIEGQGIDAAHVCLFDLNITNDWFDEYEVTDQMSIGISTGLFCKIIECLKENQKITLQMDETDDRLHVSLEGSNNLNKYFELPLIDLDIEKVSVPNEEYDVDIEIESNLFTELVDEFSLFHDFLSIQCDEEYINMFASGENGKMAIKISNEDIIMYAINEGETISLSFSLLYFHKMCMFRKISSSLTLCLGDDMPMKMVYKLGDNTDTDNNYIRFFLAAKIED